MAGGIGNVVARSLAFYVVGIINNVQNLCSVSSFWQQIIKVSSILVGSSRIF
jgi:ribose/xylose/arabinose/galactoside ABC-type transport system permease subunit